MYSSSLQLKHAMLENLIMSKGFRVWRVDPPIQFFYLYGFQTYFQMWGGEGALSGMKAEGFMLGLFSIYEATRPRKQGKDKEACTFFFMCIMSVDICWSGQWLNLFWQAQTDANGDGPILYVSGSRTCTMACISLVLFGQLGWTSTNWDFHSSSHIRKEI